MDLIVFLVLLLLGYVFGQLAEKRHFRSLMLRERQFRHILCFTEKRIPEQGPVEASLVSGNVVISIDYFKRFVAGLRNLIGGRVSAYESLLERARREAILRMKEEARKQGAKSIWNIRIETASIYKGTGNEIGSVEVLAYGTAIRPGNAHE